MSYAKAYYCVFFAGLCCLTPYLAVHFRHAGMTGAQIGTLTAIPPVMRMIVSPFWGALADTFKRTRLLLEVATAGCVAGAAMLWVNDTFSALLLGIAVFALFNAPMIPLVDNSVMDTLGDRRDEYGRVRLWGAIGWGTISPLIGLIIDNYGLHWSFIGYFIGSAALIYVISRLPIGEIHMAESYIKGLSRLLHDVRWFFFLMAIFVAGFGLSMVHVYLFVYMEDLRAPWWMMGLSMTFSTSSEMTTMFFGAKLLRRWGPRNLIILALVLLSLRLLAYSFVVNPAWILPIQLFHGPTFGLFWLAGVARAHQLAPQGLGATAQSLFVATFLGFGTGVGAKIGGRLYDVFMGNMYSLAAGGVLIGLAIYLVAGFFYVQRQGGGQPPPG